MTQQPITQPIRVVYDTKSFAYRSKMWLAYVSMFGLFCGDGLRYAIGWVGFGIWSGVLFIALCIMLARSKPQATLRRVPWYLWVLFATFTISALLSSYQMLSLLALGVTLITTSFAVWLAAAFDWRLIHRVLANSLRTAILGSLIFEFVAAAIVRGPIPPIFKNYEGDVPPSRAYYWTQGNLFNGDRIQGILGNANLLAYAAMLSLIIFAIEYAIKATHRWLSVVSLIASAICLALAKSAGIAFAVTAVIATAIVSIAAEGKDYETRHRYYRVAWSVAGVIGFLVLSFRAEVFSFLGKSPDMTGRTMIWRKVLGLIPDRPLQGYGWLGYWVPGVKPYEGLVVIHHVPYYQAHNAFLDVWLQAGLFAILAFVTLVVFTFVKLWQLAVRHTSALYLWPILVFVGLIVQNFTESRLLTESGWALLMLFAIKVYDPSELLEPVGKTPKRARLLGLGLRRNQPQQQTDR